jgi:hypothetical protein
VELLSLSIVVGEVHTAVEEEEEEEEEAVLLFKAH